MSEMITRALTGIVFVIVMVTGTWFDESRPYLYMVIALLGLWEYFTLHQFKLAYKIISTLIGLALILLGYQYLPDAIRPVLILPYLVAMAYLYIKEPIKFTNFSIWLGALIFVVIPILMTLYLDLVYVNILLTVLFIIWANDTFAYLVGSQFGRTRLFERISPKKSWEGFAGGAIAAISLSYLLKDFVDLDWPEAIGLGLVIVVFGTFGDLIESMLKRNLGVKDSGKLLPGHGGILDRFDAFLIAIPFVYLYLSALSAM